ncbi:MAG: cation diffusion facilitator family transporter [Planctomycetaceae bacterium]|nr:cation diffusion facilitator family transporter [Planctomycetaceae bacterium]
MGHAHNHSPVDYNRAFALGVGLNTVFVVAEAGFGVATGSLALLADAGHNLSDVLGLLLAWGANWLARQSPTRRRTYGWRRSSILAALLNAMLLLVAVGGISWEAIRRLIAPEPAPGPAVIWVAAVGIIINSGTALLFLRGGERDINIRGAFLHMAADAAVSLGVVVAGILMQRTGWSWLDPATSLVIAVVILAGTWGLFRESLNLALDAVPAGIDPQAVDDYLSGLPGVAAVHDLHIWALGTTETALTAHLVVPNRTDHDALLADLSHELHDRFGIEHATVQIERGTSEACPSGTGCEIPPARQ